MSLSKEDLEKIVIGLDLIEKLYFTFTEILGMSDEEAKAHFDSQKKKRKELMDQL